MAVGTYSLYAGDGVTPIAIPRPNNATWETIPRGTFADGTARVSRYKRVVWKFSRLSGAQYQAIVASRLAGRQTFETWVRPEGAVAGQFVVCTGIMAETIPANEVRGEYRSATVTWTLVEEA